MILTMCNVLCVIKNWLVFGINLTSGHRNSIFLSNSLTLLASLQYWWREYFTKILIKVEVNVVQVLFNIFYLLDLFSRQCLFVYAYHNMYSVHWLRSIENYDIFQEGIKVRVELVSYVFTWITKSLTRGKFL